MNSQGVGVGYGKADQGGIDGSNSIAGNGQDLGARGWRPPQEEQSYVTVSLANRETGAEFLIELCVHHVGDKFEWAFFPEHWRQTVRNAGVDPYSELGERFLNLAARWAFIRSRVVHATLPDCSNIACEARYRRRDATFYCAKCGRLCCWCLGADSDERGDFCDDCHSDAEAIFDLTRIRRIGSTARAVALREAAYLGAGEDWAQLETVAVELRRADAAFSAVKGQSPCCSG